MNLSIDVEEDMNTEYNLSKYKKEMMSSDEEPPQIQFEEEINEEAIK